MDENTSGQNFNGAEGQADGEARKSPLPVIALILSIIALVASWLPVAGFILAALALVISIVAKVKSSKGGMAIAAIVISVFALLSGMASAACGLVAATVGSEMKKELNAQGLDISDLAQFGKMARDLQAQEAASAKATPEERRETAIAQLEKFRERYKAATGKEYDVDMDTIRKNMADADDVRLTSIQNIMTVTSVPIFPPEGFEKAGEQLKRFLFPAGTIPISEATDDDAQADDAEGGEADQTAE